MSKTATSDEAVFLRQAYRELDFQNGDLIEEKKLWELDEQNFVDKAQWLNLCRYLNRNKTFKAESIFFVDNNPVVVFVSSAGTPHDKLYEIFNQIWCMANPRLLFIATPTSLNVYNLGQKPARNQEELTSLETVKNIADIASVLKKYRREAIESGEVFGDQRFNQAGLRADDSLVQDIKTVRKKLFESGLKQDNIKYAHALIGRSIFIRYLEDRGIITKEYFYEVAKGNPQWQTLLEAKPLKSSFLPEMEHLLYLKVLSNFDFTYKLYEKLAGDFNGDMFPTDNREMEIVTPEHLLILKNFLTGEIQEQESLFFWAYKFDIIPIELISNIYEELYHYENPGDTLKVNDGTHYTPASLVEFLLARVLTVPVLKGKPKIMDPACGSGIFLVEAFRRLVRYELFLKKEKKLSFNRLEEILKNQVRGIELNPEAVRIAAFSLYLAFLHYQDPPDILEQIKNKNKLPHLIYTPNKKRGKKYFDILVHANAFAIEEAIPDEKIKQEFLSNSSDIVIGNPPWGRIPKEDDEGKKALTWCKTRQKAISNNEYSQAFLWRAIDLLKENGTSGLLVSSNVILRKSSSKSSALKKEMFKSISIKEIVNFSNVRHLFFSGAISPFISFMFEKKEASRDSSIIYWTARRSKIIENAKSVVLDKTDYKFFKFADTQTEDIWKIYYVGNHRDHSLISGLRLYPMLKTFEAANIKRRQGYKIAKSGRKKSEWLKNFEVLPIDALVNRYGPIINFEKRLKPAPKEVREKGTPEIYDGFRILVKSGPSQKGRILARLHNERFAFTHAVNCIKLKRGEEDFYKIILGILWSSLLRYYFFMTSSKWPIWYDQIYLNEIMNMPVALPDNENLKARIINVVDKLRNYAPTLLQGHLELQKLETELDEAIFEMYLLTKSECDLVRARCNYDIDFFYNKSVNRVQLPYTVAGTLQTLPKDRLKQSVMEGYLHVFLESWHQEIEEGKELNWEIIHHPTIPMIALIFNLQDKGAKKNKKPSPGTQAEWAQLLARIEKETQIPYGKRIYIEGIIRYVSEEQIIIIKRDDERLWTRSSAYEDVEATLLQTMIREKRLNAKKK
ncbi:MAG: N-6 DNA methylase [bacterium]|nr:N-6 DNA methylase [bacterium]